MKVSELGEFGLIDRLTEALAARPMAESARRLAVGIGDDAAVWRSDGGAIIATTDTMVAGVHFLPERTPWSAVGWKALAVNASDIAAMGGTPDFALVTLALPEDALVEDMDVLYEGLADAAKEYDITIAGGDIVHAPTMAISVTLTGRAELDSEGEPVVMRRDTAKEGDVVAVTGALGGAAGGLTVLREERAESDATRALVERHLRPQARLAAGRAVLAAGVRCAIDVSDGLLQDLGHVAKASKLGAVVRRESIPVDMALLEEFEADEALQYAAAGGEDYELVFVGRRERIEGAARGAGVPVTVIGEMVADAERRVRVLDAAGADVPFDVGGWDHLRGA